MTTNLVIIEDALRDIDVIAETQSATAEQGAYCLRRLNQMMELLKEKDVDIGWFAQTSTTATIPIPDWAELPITNALSLFIAPKYGASVSIELAALIDSTTRTLFNKMVGEKRRPTDLSHLPRGSGHIGTGSDIINDR